MTVNERKGFRVAINQNWKKGCGIGCGVITILLFILIGSIAFFVRDMGKDYKEVGRSEKALIQAHGGPGDYIPERGGLPTAERLLVFLEIRRAQTEWRHNVALAFEEFLVNKQANASGGFRHFFQLIRSTSEMAPSLAGFWSSRNALLLEHEMGPGEYAYLYCLAYYSYLGYDPGDGAQETDLDFNAGGGADLKVSAEIPKTEAQRRDAAWGRIHDLMLPLLEGVDRSGLLVGSEEAEAWFTELDREVAALQGAPSRYPWREGAPRQLADAFRPFRKDLEEQYSIAVNPVELIFELVEEED